MKMTMLDLSFVLFFFFFLSLASPPPPSSLHSRHSIALSDSRRKCNTCSTVSFTYPNRLVKHQIFENRDAIDLPHRTLLASFSLLSDFVMDHLE
jgi:hypothetical protein